MRDYKISVTTNSGGAGTGYSTRGIKGYLYAVAYLPGTLDTGATVTVTCDGDVSVPILVKATAGTSNLLFYPRVAEALNTDGTALSQYCMPVLTGALCKVVIASGGNTLTGSVILYVED